MGWHVDCPLHATLMVGQSLVVAPFIAGTINFLELPKLIFASKNVKRLMCRKTNCLITDFHISHGEVARNFISR